MVNFMALHWYKKCKEGDRAALQFSKDPHMQASTTRFFLVLMLDALNAICSYFKKHLSA